MKLVAAIELVSEANKDRPSHRRTFATKCASYLQRGVSVVVIDVVTSQAANLHAELIELLHLTDAFEWVSPSGLSAVCYRVVQGTQKVGLAVGNGQLPVGHAPRAGDDAGKLRTVCRGMDQRGRCRAHIDSLQGGGFSPDPAGAPRGRPDSISSRRNRCFPAAP